MLNTALEAMQQPPRPVEQVLLPPAQPKQTPFDINMSEAKRKSLALEIIQYLDAAKRSTQNLQERWDEQEKMAYSVQEIDKVHGVAMIFYPLVQPILENVTNRMVYTMAPTDPFVSVSFIGGGQADEQQKLERIMTFFLMLNGMWKQVLYKAIWKTGFQHRCHARVMYVPSEFGPPRFSIDVIDAKLTRVYPSGQGRLQDKLLVSHRSSDVALNYERLMDKGVYAQPLSGNWKAGSEKRSDESEDPQLAEFRKQVENDDPGTVPEINSFEGLFRHKEDGVESWYLFTILENTQDLIRFKRFKQKEIWYATGVFKDEDHYWPSSGLCTALQPLQNEFNSVANLGIDALAFSALNAWSQVPTGQHGGMPAKQITEIFPGMVMPPGIELKPAIPAARSLEVLPWLQDIWRRAQIVAAVPETNFGMALEGADTLGEVQIAKTEGMIGEDGRNQMFANTFCVDVFNIMKSQLYANWDDWYPVYGAHLGLQPQDRFLLQKPCIMTTPTQSMRQTPLGRRAEIERFAAAMMKMFRPFLKRAGHELAQQYAATFDLPNTQQTVMTAEEVEIMLRRVAEESKQAPPQQQSGGGTNGDTDFGGALSEPSGQSPVEGALASAIPGSERNTGNGAFTQY